MTDKPTIFIGSSSEGLLVAQFLHAHLETDFRPFLWTHGMFVAGRYTLDELERAANEHDFAILCATPDDVLVKRGTSYSSMRDNVLFEYGLFMGARGRKNTFLLVPRLTDLAIPTDLMGLTLVQYDADRFAMSEPDKHAALQSAAMKLRTAIQKSWTEIRAARAKALREEMEMEQTKSIQRLLLMIVDLRDLFIELPAEVLESLGNQPRFERVKQKAADKVDSIAEQLGDDAKIAGVVEEFNEMVAATREGVITIPYPLEILVDEAEVKKIALLHAQNAIGDFIDGKRPFESFGNAVAEELTRRLATVSDKYRSWWSKSERRLQRATSKLQSALLGSMIQTRPRQRRALAESAET